ncbi:SAM-dependent methyltransferase [Symbioplanes lichenis]|uniref:SAM-dependent methyltransferase n=1 Tax=Symbioplanes lichenis TaxID=1629072 RepID=UPI0027385AC8|nr:SAM-dependent methyltransferase [Actinoplanes lichenis]
MSQPDTSVPQSARIWNYWLGGSYNFPVDRGAGAEYLKVFPGISELARESRRYLTRAVTWLAGEAGITQFLDAGAGLPAADNTHQIVQRTNPAARVVYVDKDPYVLENGRLMLEGTTGVTYAEADLQNPTTVLAAAARDLDLSRPLALILNGVLGHIPSTAEARHIVSTLVAGLASGSYASISDGSLQEQQDAGINLAQDAYNTSGAVPYNLRTPAEFAEFFTGLELVPPGIVPLVRWRPEPGDDQSSTDQYGGIGRKP